MGATFSRVKSWIAEKLTFADLNAEINNILNNFTPAGMDDYSASVAEMQTQTDPGELGTESQANSMAGEIERMRYELKQIKGTTYWYENPITTLAGLNAAFGVGALASTRLVSGVSTAGSSQSVLLTPQGAGNGDDVVINAAATDFIYRIDDIEYTATADVTIASTTSAPVANNTATVNEAAYSDQAWTKYVGMHGTGLPIDAIGSEITSLNGKTAAFRLTTGAGSEYFMAIPDTTNNQLTSVQRGFFFDESNAPVPSIVFADDDVITLMKIAWIFFDSSQAASVTYTEPVVSSVEPSSPANGDFWYDMPTGKWKKYNGIAYDDTNAVYVGMSIQDENGDCVGARSADFVRVMQDLNTLNLNKYTDTTVTTNKQARFSVFGTAIDMYNDSVIWSMASDLDDGITEAASTLYFLYMKEDSTPVISHVAPDDFTSTRGGLYHPQQTWRCFGQVWNNGSSNLEKLISYHHDNISTAKAAASINASALTLEYWASPLANYGFYEQDSVIETGANIAHFPFYQSITVPSGATLDHLSTSTAFGNPLAATDNVVLHLVREANTVVLGVSSHQHGQRQLVTTVELDATSDIGSLYSMTAYTSAQVRAVAYGHSTQTTAGTWAADLKSFGAFASLNICRSKSVDGLARTTTSASYSSAGTATFYVTGRRRIRLFVESDTNSATGVGSFEVFNNAGTLALGYLAFFKGATRLRTYRLKAQVGGASSVKVEYSLTHMTTLNPAELGTGSSTFDLQVASDGTATITVSDGRMTIEELPYDEVSL